MKKLTPTPSLPALRPEKRGRKKIYISSTLKQKEFW
jgi:hypothetical protein